MSDSGRYLHCLACSSHSSGPAPFARRAGPGWGTSLSLAMVVRLWCRQSTLYVAGLPLPPAGLGAASCTTAAPRSCLSSVITRADLDFLLHTLSWLRLHLIPPHPHPVSPPGNAALMAPANGLNGVLPVAALHKNGPGPVPPTRGPRAAQPRLKLICRRLPPGLTKAEFEGVLGDQWRVGAGKVDWLSYKKGSVSTEYARPLCVALPLTFVQCCQTFQARPRLPPCHQARPRQASRRPHSLCHIPRCCKVMAGPRPRGPARARICPVPQDARRPQTKRQPTGHH